MTKHKEKDRAMYRSLFRGVLLNLLTTAPALLGFGIILSSKGPLKYHVLGWGFFLAGLSGIIVVARKEIPMSIGSIRGKWAIVQGAVFTAICWGLALYALFLGL